MNNYDATVILNWTTTTGNSADICSVRNNSLTNIYSWFSEGISKTQPASPKFLKLRYVVFLYVIVNHFFGADLSLLKESFLTRVYIWQTSASESYLAYSIIPFNFGSLSNGKFWLFSSIFNILLPLLFFIKTFLKINQSIIFQCT